MKHLLLERNLHNYVCGCHRVEGPFVAVLSNFPVSGIHAIVNVCLPWPSCVAVLDHY